MPIEYNVLNTTLIVYNIIFYLILMGIINNRDDILLILLMFEVSYLVIITLFALCTLSRSISQTYCLLFLILAASESAVGLAVLITSYNYLTNTKFSCSELLHG